MKINIDKYVLAVVVISVVIAFLTHFPELISLFDHSGQDNLFPGMRIADVANEIFLHLSRCLSCLLLIRCYSVLTGRRRVLRGGK